MSASGRSRSSFVLASPPSSPSSPCCRSESLGLLRASVEEKMLSPSSSSACPCIRAPVDSPVSTLSLVLTEMESEEEDEDAHLNGYTAGLAERIAHSMLQEDTEDAAHGFCGQANAAWSSQVCLSSPPQSIPTGCGYWGDGLKGGRERTSPASSSELSSPPSPPWGNQAEEDALNLLYVELIRLKMEDEMRLHAAAEATQHCRLQLDGRPMLVTSRSLNSGPMSTSRNWTGYAAEHQGSKVKNEFGAGKTNSFNWPPQSLQQTPHPHQNYSNGRMRGGVSWGCVGSNTAAYHYHTPSSGVPQQAVRNGSGMRAVFLDTRGSRQSGGTGVFLPRRAGSGSDARRKPACSTVLLPSRIVQALNLNIEDTLSCPASALAMVASRDRGAFSARARNSQEASPKCRSGWTPLHSQVQEVTPDVRLPTEWTY